MLKQAMGLFAMNMDYRSDNKAYRLQTAQTPLVQNDMYLKYELNDYACGTNGTYFLSHVSLFFLMIKHTLRSF